MSVLVYVYPDARVDTPSEPPTTRDLTALAWSLDLDNDLDFAEPAPSVDELLDGLGEGHGRRG